MAVPKKDSLIRPALECVSEHNGIKRAEVTKCVADKLALSKEDRNEKVSSGRSTKLSVRVSWALTYLKQAALIESPNRGYFLIADRGKKALADGQEINKKYLEQYEGFRDFMARTKYDNKELMYLLLECINGRNGINRSDLKELVADRLGLSHEKRKQDALSGRIFHRRVVSSLRDLRETSLVTQPKLGHYKITKQGKEFLTDGKNIDNKNLEQLQQDEQDSTASSIKDIIELQKQINSELADEILGQVLENSPAFFEKLIVTLLEKMNYGAEQENSGQVLGKSGDDGVDGVINQDELGVEKIYVQAKRYARDNRVGSKHIRDFSGALRLKQCEKGLFFTTSFFSQNAKSTATALGIVLIDGKRLATLMIKHDVGCTVDKTLHIKKVDTDFFIEEADDDNIDWEN